jgi:hypothetical protein
MKIELEYPYNQDYKTGYIIDGSENRKTVILIANDNSYHSTSYARYLMSTYLKRYLLDTETVDHINEDKTDDRIENLQILSSTDNIKKHHTMTYKPYEHGTYRSYRHNKCRCLLCIEANKDVQKRYYKKHKDEINLKRKRKDKDI